MEQSDLNRTIEEKYIQKLEKHADGLRANKFYSMQRIDLLIISVSGAGIYVSLEIMKYIAASKILTLHQVSHLNNYFKMTGLLFTLSIIINFISQWSAYYESAHALKSTTDDIYAREHQVDMQKEIDKSDHQLSLYKRLTKFTNNLSTGLMFSGLLCIMIFIWIIF
jgi:hypothetical protein